MRAISLWRPWPWTIFHGGKPVENRGWKIDYRGDILLHASKKFDNDSVPFIERALRATGYKPPLMLSSAHPEGLIGIVEIVDCVPIEEIGAPAAGMGWWVFGPFCWVLANPRPFAQPIPWKGKQGIFGVPDSVVIAGAP